MTNEHATKGKDVIYIDAEDEITGIIDKVHASSQRIVALVLPKRATVLQSIVNMKLLKRSSEEAKKHVVLITSEAGLLPLAGSVGLRVAKSLQSKPEVPDAPAAGAGGKDEPIEETADEGDAPLDKSKPIGELAGDDDNDEPIELDNADETPAAAASGKKDKKGKDKKLKIPNFTKFRLWLLLGGVGVALLVALGILMFMILPKAEIVVNTDSSAIVSSQDVTFRTGDDATLDVEEAIIPATKQQTTKTLTKEVPATGEENKGETATGSVTMTGQDCTGPSYSPPNDVPAGAGLSTGSNTYVTQKKASFSPSSFDPASGCFMYTTGTVNITAQTSGSKFNVSSASFTVAGRSGVSASGSASGGTDKVVKVVQQSDIDAAKEQISQEANGSTEQELADALRAEGLHPVTETFATSAADVKTTPSVGTEADKVTVTQEMTYTMLGVKEDDLKKIIENSVADDIDPQKQSILDYGIKDGSFTLQNEQGADSLVGMRVTVVAGPDLKVDEIKDAVKGKKGSEAQAIIKENPGVTDVEVSYGPFWVSSIPSNTSKITVTIEEPEAAPSEESESEDNNDTNNNAESE